MKMVLFAGIMAVLIGLFYFEEKEKRHRRIITRYKTGFKIESIENA